MTKALYALSGEFLRFEGTEPSDRIRIAQASAIDYFRELIALDTEWVINLDEDAFLLDPQAILGLIQQMEKQGYAACGMPDGGVVSIRSHHPAVCNAFFNIFDIRRVRRACADWNRVCTLRHRREYERFAPSFARRTPFAFDDFEPYYCVFFALLEAGERILYLSAEQWQDGVTTVVNLPDGKPLLMHAWYAREWATDIATQRRYEAVLTCARQHQKQPGYCLESASSIDVPDAVLAKTLVGVVVHDRN